MLRAYSSEPACRWKMTEGSTTEDGLLGGGVRLIQQASGYRVAIDPVLLAAAVPAAAGDHVLDAGAGVAAAALCLAARVAGARVSGLESQRSLVRLANENAGLNGMTDRVTVMEGDLLRPPPRLAPGSFDHVMANPPYLEPARASIPADPGKAAANVEGAAGLGAWIAFCLTMVKDKGSVTIIHRADRLDALLAALHRKSGEIVVFPLWPMADGRPAKRVIVRARKGVASPTRLAAGLVLHGADGAYTPAAEAVLRQGAPLDL
ncbi:MAG TPA: methyltransferase [Alphaproteobacteria bacterium]|nr:methyltransferase [Alphaproteobacteria bacterium]